MPNKIILKKKISRFNKKIFIPGDKSISIRWVLISSIASGVSKAKNLLMSEDVLASIRAIKKLGARVVFKKNICEINGVGMKGYKYRKKIVINSQNSGTLGRLISGILIDTPYPIKIIGDKSLSKRDFKRIALPLRKFGASFHLHNNCNLPLIVKGSQKLKPIRFFENRGSAQCKSSVIFGGIKVDGTTIIKAKKSRNHTELLFKHLGLPIKIKKIKNFDIIEINKVEKIKPINYIIPSDISSGAFFIALAVLSEKSKLVIKNVNVNPTRIGVIKILKMMGAKIKFVNQRKYKGERISDIFVKSSTNLKGVNCPTSYNSSAIDEFLVIFLVAAKSKGISYFKNLSELNQKESPRLIWASKILKLLGIKNKTTKSSIKIYGNPNLNFNKKIIIKNFLRDHRIFMMSVVAALTFGGKWKIYDCNSIKTSFPKFLEILKKIKA